jgi:hypothetical protein
MSKRTVQTDAPWSRRLKGDPLPWLLEKEDPGARYLAMRHVLGLPAEDRELRRARREAHTHGPIAAVLDKMDRSGYWVQPGPGYGPKYRSTVWSLILLAQLGARVDEDRRIAKATGYYLDSALCEGGQISSSSGPGGTVDCLQGNMLWALTELGCEEERLRPAVEWTARSVTGEGISPASEKDAPRRYYASKCGPTFACGANNKKPCAWGGVKVMLALAVLPGRKPPLVRRAISRGAEFLLDGNPAQAGYPNGWASRPSGNWWKFGFPIFYVTDLLQNVEALAAAGFARDPRLRQAVDLICEKQDDSARWNLEYDYRGKTWVNFGAKGKPNKWVTIRALRVLKATV